MGILTKLNLQNLVKNRARTIMTIAGVALSVALILTVGGFITSFIATERNFAIEEYGDFHIMYLDIPGNYVAELENNSLAEVQYYANHVDCGDEMGEDFFQCYGFSAYPRQSYTPITDKNNIIRDAEHEYNVFLKYKDATRSDFSRKMLSRALTDAGYDGPIIIRENTTLAVIDGDLPETTRIVLFWVAFLGIAIMAIVAAFVIRNSFNISITERVRQFGMLASIGTRPRQIRFMVYQEGLFIGLVAIPLGILLGAGATFILTLVVNHLFDGLIAYDMLFYIPLSFYAIIAGVGLFIIFLAAASPAIVASRVSPIAALRNVQDIKVKARKVRTSKITQKIWGIGGVIAAKNLKRSRQKYRTTVISIVVSVSVFIGVSSFMMYGHRILELFVQDNGANFILSVSDDSVYDNVIERFRPKEYALYHAIASYGEEAKPNIYITSRDEFARYARENGYLVADYTQLAILQDHYSGRDFDGNIIYTRGTDYKAGDEITYQAVKIIFDAEEESEQPEEFEEDIEIIGTSNEKISDPETLKISAVVEDSPLGWASETITPNGAIFISEDHPFAQKLRDYWYDQGLFIADSGLGEDIADYVEDLNEQKIAAGERAFNYYYQNVEEAARAVRSVVLFAEILTYGFIIVVSLIGITNIFNTITTNIALRAKEFAVLKSIGMTNKEFNHMIRLESAMYTTRALLIGLPIGFLMSYGVSRLFNTARLGIGWLIPWGSVAICVITVAILIAVIMRYSVRKIKKQNIIETIRQESF